MPDANDMDLLREYAGSGSELAFGQIVQRHINLVYSVALRFTGNGEDARDVTQAVFIVLAKKAASLRAKTVVTGWLYETTRFAAMKFLTNKSRRQAREQEAYMQSTLNDAETESIWSQLAPLLEGAMARLSEKERMLIALRFFENKSNAETAALAGMNEWAARKRVHRALEKLRNIFVQQGISSAMSTIADTISANSVQAAPSFLAKSVSAAAAAKGAAASPSTLTIVKGALKIMAWSNVKTAIVAGAAVILAVGSTTLIIQHQLQRHAPAQTDFPRNSWSFAGYATPEDTAQSLFWALRESDSNSFQIYLNGLVPELHDKMQQEVQNRGRNAFANLSAHEIGGVTRYRILKRVMLSDNKAQLRIQFGGLNGPIQTLAMEKIGNEWKCAGE